MQHSRQSGQSNTAMIAGGIVVVVLIVILGWWFYNRNAAEVEIEPDLLEEATPLMDDEPQAPSVSPSAFPSPIPSPVTSPVVSGSPAASPAAGQVKSFTVAAANFSFTPKEIRVKTGDTVRITLTNNSTMPHDWKVDAFSAATKVITNGQTDTIEFVANKAGTYEYYCSVGQHRQQGMVGSLIVE
jgi:nitrite reductase (NO-forming)